MKIVRVILVPILVCGGIWLAICAAIGTFAVEGSLHPPRTPAGPEGDAEARSIATRDHSVLEDVSIRAEDGATLVGWSIRPQAGNGNAVILLHGVSDNRAGMVSFADMLLRHGYAVLLPDARAHGASGGDIATYGIDESGDVRNWVDWIKQFDMPHCIYGLGESMGAAQLLQSLVRVPEFCAVVAESGFSTFRDAAFDRVGQQFRTGPWLGRTLLRPAIEEGFIYARIRYKINFAAASPLRAVTASHIPILLIHGLADTNLPPRHSEQMKASNPAIVLWEPPNAGHCGASDVEPAEFERRVVGWFESHSLR